MDTKYSTSPLDGVSFEDIMSEEASTPDIKQSRRSSDRSRPSDGGAKSSAASAKFTIIENYGKLSERKNAASFMLVDWNGYERYDLRSWSDDYSTPHKGMTFTEDELPDLLRALSDYVVSSHTAPLHLYEAGKTTAKILDIVCTLSSSTSRGVTWNKQVSIVDWGYGAKFDFRKWTESYDKCSKGICLNEKELAALVAILKTL